MYKVVPAARRAATVATTASGSSLPVVLAARTVAATPSPVHSSKARRYTHGLLAAWTPRPTQCRSRASPRRSTHLLTTRPERGTAPLLGVWAPFARCRRRKGACVRAARASTSRQSRSSCRCYIKLLASAMGAPCVALKQPVRGAANSAVVVLGGTP